MKFFPPVLLDFRVITKYFNHTSAHSTFHLNNEIGFLMREMAEFRIELGGRFLYSRYFAVRSAKGFYRDTLAVNLDLTAIRKLEWQQRLPDWHNATGCLLFQDKFL